MIKYYSPDSWGVKPEIFHLSPWSQHSLRHSLNNITLIRFANFHFHFIFAPLFGFSFRSIWVIWFSGYLHFVEGPTENKLALDGKKKVEKDAMRPTQVSIFRHALDQK